MSKKKHKKNKKNDKTEQHDNEGNENPREQDLVKDSEIDKEIQAILRDAELQSQPPKNRHKRKGRLGKLFTMISSKVIFKFEKPSKKTEEDIPPEDEDKDNNFALEAVNPGNGDNFDSVDGAETGVAAVPEPVDVPGDRPATLGDLEIILEQIDILKGKISEMQDAYNSIKDIDVNSFKILERVGTLPQLPDKIDVSAKKTLEKVSDKLDILKKEIISHIPVKKEVPSTETTVDLKKQLEQNTIAVQSFSTNIGRIINRIDFATDEVKKTIRGLQKGWNPTTSRKDHSAFPIDDFEMMQGKVVTIENTTLQIKKALEAQPAIEQKKELAPFNADDEIIADLARYSHAIIDQLALGARHYALNKVCIEDIAKERKRNQEKIDTARIESLAQGEQNGMKQTIKDLVDKYDDLDMLFESDDSSDKIVTQFLHNLSFKRDPQLIKGSLIEITPENRDSFQGRATFIETGAYIVTHSCFKFGDDVQKYAQLTACQGNT